MNRLNALAFTLILLLSSLSGCIGDIGASNDSESDSENPSQDGSENDSDDELDDPTDHGSENDSIDDSDNNSDNGSDNDAGNQSDEQLDGRVVECPDGSTTVVQ